MLLVGLLFVLGILMSAFFSGSETGFYRATRVRLVLDGMSGDLISRGLLWLMNHPTIFVATALIGNNLANYLVSHAVVLGTRLLSGGDHALAEVLMPIALTPLVFVYGELLPKSLFFLAPNRLLRAGGALLLGFTLLLAPVTAALWLLGRPLQLLFGESPVLARWQLARQELRQLLDEGHQLGILQPVQRSLAQAIFDHGSEPLHRYCIPASRLPHVTSGDSAAQLLRVARQRHTSELLVTPANPQQLAGYVRTIDVLLSGERWPQAIRPLPKLQSSEPHTAALMTLRSTRELMAEVVDRQGRAVGIVTLERLMTPLYREA